MEVLCSSRFASPIGPLRIVTSQKGLVYVELPHASGRGFEGWRRTHAPEAEVVDRRTDHEDVIDQLLEFLASERREFAIELDLRATDFQRAVYDLVARIPYGETLCYSEVADAIGRPKAVRAVGAANGANPIPLVIPCHRVIARDGALQGYAGGLDVKARLLAMESVLPAPSAVQERLF
ncbi:MAG: methylated-DNA--[protein]-cysteine S-methyltransferase [Deltaproteobacteria bacterium]|jgi:O-6-methylguanine DNA methyltransferase|nr:methylated-DNA--[protein]-cysteine S-methyltransferase [Deltaproteobacteria bacterium]MBW2500565.1 methylated-DNA--[protein]-cysteine S-methyltransferase [Deltaproteobacteria bacterium]